MVIIKYYTTFIGKTNATYELVKTPFKEGKIITKNEAMRLIKKHGLILAYKDEHGCTWDTPDRAFYNEFKGRGKEIKK